MAVIANWLRTRWEAWAEPERAAPDPHQPRTNRMRIWEHSEVWGRIGSRDIKHGHTFTVSVPNGSVFIAATMLGGFLRTHWFVCDNRNTQRFEKHFVIVADGFILPSGIEMHVYEHALTFVHGDAIYHLFRSVP